MPPAVAEARQLRLAPARVVLDRQLADGQVLLGRPDHHLGRELHAGRAQVERGQRAAADAAHAAVRVAHPGSEEQVQHAGEHRVAHVAVVPRHRARMDVLHPVAHHEIGPLIELRQEARDVVEVVGEVGVGHDDVIAARRREAGPVGTSVSAPVLEHDLRARRAGDVAAAVGRGVVHDDHLAGDARLRQRVAGTGHALGDVLRLVQARDDDRDADGPLGRACLWRRGCGVPGRAHHIRQPAKGPAWSRWPSMLEPAAPCGSASSTTACTRTR